MKVTEELALRYGTLLEKNPVEEQGHSGVPSSELLSLSGPLQSVTSAERNSTLTALITLTTLLPLPYRPGEGQGPVLCQVWKPLWPGAQCR